MRAHARFPLVIVSFLIAFALPASGVLDQESRPAPRRVPGPARHFAERPPVIFEVERLAERGPRVIVTNLYQEPLTAFVVQVDEVPGKLRAQTLICDAVTRVCGFPPIPRGLSFLMGVPRVLGEPPPNAKLAAVLWEDGSTYGPEDLLQQIAEKRGTRQ